MITLNFQFSSFSIKCYVLSKSELRQYKNQRTEGQLFNVDFQDKSGVIRANCFDQHINKFYENIIVNKWYFVSSCRIKPANKDYSNLKNDYELIFEESTIVELCETQESAPEVNYKFLTIEEVIKSKTNSFVDIMAIVSSASGIMTRRCKKTDKEVIKRDIYIKDSKSDKEIRCTLWAEKAQIDLLKEHDEPVIVIIGAMVNEYNGNKELSVKHNATLKINPETHDAKKFREMYQEKSNF